MTNGEKQRGMPTWAKVLIGLVVVAIVGGVTMVIGSVIFIQNMYKQALDPAAIARVAGSIGTFPDPLPDGYKFAMGLDVAGIKTLTVEHKPDKQTVIMMSFPRKEDDPKDAQALVNELYEKGVSTQQTSAKFETVKSRGTEAVDGAQMPYIVGEMTDKTGSKFDGLVACIVSPTRHQTILIYGIQPPGSTYNFDATLKLLKSIKGI